MVSSSEGRVSPAVSHRMSAGVGHHCSVTCVRHSHSGNARFQQLKGVRKKTRLVDPKKGKLPCCCYSDCIRLVSQPLMNRFSNLIDSLSSDLRPSTGSKELVRHDFSLESQADTSSKYSCYLHVKIVLEILLFLKSNCQPIVCSLLCVITTLTSSWPKRTSESSRPMIQVNQEWAAQASSRLG